MSHIAQDYDWFCSRSREALSNFEPATANAIHLFPTNEEVKHHNTSVLKSTAARQRCAIAVLDAHNSSLKASKAKKKIAVHENRIMLCKGAQVMLTQNLWTTSGYVSILFCVCAYVTCNRLVNGAVGTVVDFIGNDGNCEYVVVEVGKYSGPPLCGPEPERYVDAWHA